ncbi:MAG: amidohydrolase, partial [Bryobacteraceae bacterium]
MRFLRSTLLAALLLNTAFGEESTAHRQIKDLVDRSSPRYVKASETIWGYAELGYQEEKSSSLLQRSLQEAGFRVEAGVAG